MGKSKRRLNRRESDCKGKVLKLLKGILKDIFVGVIIGIVIAAITWYAGNQRATHEIQKKLQTVGLGETKAYIEDIFGVPVVEVEYDDERLQYFGLTEAFYKFDHCVLHCVYSENTVVAFFVTVNKKGIYKVGRKLNKSLGTFSYYDFGYTGETSIIVDVNRPANNDDYFYYQEVYYGAGPADYNYYVLASYKDYVFNTKGASESQLIGYFENAGIYDNDELDSSVFRTDECINLRKEVRPNTYGMIRDGYEDTIIVAVPGRTFGAVLFDDWAQD